MFRKKVQPKSEPLWTAYPAMAPYSHEEIPPQGGDATIPWSGLPYDPELIQQWLSQGGGQSNRALLILMKAIQESMISMEDCRRAFRVDPRLIGEDEQ